MRVRMSTVADASVRSPWDTDPITDQELLWTKSICPYCGVGCGILVGHKDGKLHKIRGDASHPANKGLLCAKGGTLAQVVQTPDRLLFPMIRESRDGAFQRVLWSQVIERISSAIQKTLTTHGPESFAFYISGQLLTEDYYVINKFAKGFLGTNNVDSNSRLCMASAVAGYQTSLGADGPPACYEDIECSDCFFLIGTNMEACHPVLFQRIRMRKSEYPHRVKVIVADPRRTKTAELADLYLPLKPGTDVALLNSMMFVLNEEGFIDQGFIERHTSGWPDLKRVIGNYPPPVAARLCGLEESIIIKAARIFGKAPSALSFWSMGLNQSTSGVAKNNSVINLHLATGKIGKPGSGPFSLTGQPNAMGGRETGGLAHLLPGHRFIANEKHREEMERFWEVPKGSIHRQAGLSAVELFKALEDQRIKVLWVVATNPMVSVPNLRGIRKSFERAELVIVQDPYHPTETTREAHVILPAAQWSERDGTLTNSERRISLTEKIVDPPGEAKPDWEIVCAVAQAMGFVKPFSFSCAASVFEEYKKTTKGTEIDITGVSYERLTKEPVQWPCPGPDSPSTIRLYTDDRFFTSDRKARLIAHEYREPAEILDKDFPMTLTTGRVRDHWHTLTRTAKVDYLVKQEPYAFLEVHPDDAQGLGLSDGDWVKVLSRRGSAEAPVRFTKEIRRGVCFMPFHWGPLFGEAVVNETTMDAFDPLSKQPELKFCACRIEKIEGRVRV